MTWRHDPPTRVGHRIFAAVTRVEITAHCAGRGVVAMVGKRVATILMLEGGEAEALELNGQIHTLEETVQTYPEAAIQLRAFGTASSDSDHDQ